MTNTTEPLSFDETRALLPLVLVLNRVLPGDELYQLDLLSPDLRDRLVALGWLERPFRLTAGGRDCLERIGFAVVEGAADEAAYRSSVVQS